MESNQYFNRFFGFAGANLIACVFYFLTSAILGAAGVELPESTSTRLLSVAVTTIPFLAAVFIATLRDKTLPRGLTAHAYFADIARTDLVSFAVWALLGAMVAVSGEAAGFVVFLFIAQSLPCALTISLLGTLPGLLAGVVISFVLYIAARLCAILLRK